MTLWRHAYCGYASYTGTPHTWGQGEHDAHKLVMTLKGKPINGYATFKRGDGKWVTITKAAPGGAFEIWGEYAAREAVASVPAGALIVPVPSSDCLALGTDKKGRQLADALTAYAGQFDAVDALHWRERLPKAQGGGTRNANTLMANLVLPKRLPAREVVLVDDVATTGGHLLACAWALRRAGHTVEHAICVAQTVWEPPRHGMFVVDSKDLEEDQFRAL